MLKKLISLCVISSLSLLAISCASSKVVMNQEYKNPSHKEPSMVIIIKNEPFIDYDGNVEPEFGPGDQKTLINNFFKNQLVEDIRAHTSIKEILFDTCSSMGYYDNHEVVVGNSGTQSITVLGKGGSYTCRNINPTYVLTLTDIFIGTAFETDYYPGTMNSNGTMTGGHSSVSKKLTYRAQITLFDNIAKEYVEYGYISESAQGFFPVITLNVWESVSSSFVNKVFSKVHF